MRPSHYNYLKRMWTRNYCNKHRNQDGIIKNIILFPFKIAFFIMFFPFFILYKLGKFSSKIAKEIPIYYPKPKNHIKRTNYNSLSHISSNKESEIIMDKIETYSLVENDLKKCQFLANTINTTCDFREFIFSFKYLIKTLEFLSSYENDVVFKNSVPSNNLSRILEKKHITEKEFIDRHIKKYGKESLEKNRYYLTDFTVEGASYAASIIETIYPTTEK